MDKRVLHKMVRDRPDILVCKKAVRTWVRSPCYNSWDSIEDQQLVQP